VETVSWFTQEAAPTLETVDAWTQVVFPKVEERDG
jgi:hypothetical protein